jgi:hypothetical protein
LYDRNESSPFRSFKCWVPPPPNPRSMIDAEKDEASARHVHNPHACKCGYRAELVNPPARLDYKARCEEAGRHAREADAGGTTSKTWPSPQSPPGNLPFVIFRKAYNSL